MKKFLDRYVFSRFGMQLLLSIAITVLFATLISMLQGTALSDTVTGLKRWVWGFRQVSSPISSINTIDSMASSHWNVQSYLLLFMSLLAWFISIAVYSFITGAIVNAFRNRQKLIDDGQVRYSFKHHTIIVGWDFQGITIAKKYLSDKSNGELLIVSNQKAQDIRDELKLFLSPEEMQRAYIYNGNIHLKSTLHSLCAEQSRDIVVLGEKGCADNNGGNLLITRILSEYVYSLRAKVKREDKIKLFLQIDDISLYLQTRNMQLPSNTDTVFDVTIFNYYESWAWQCWSALEDRPNEYLPLLHKPGSKHAELFVIGATPMGQAFVYYAMPLMNYGVDKKHNRITLFDTKSDGGTFLPRKDMLEALPEVEVRFVSRNGCSDEADAIMQEAAEREDTSVTVVIAIANPDEAAKTYVQLSKKLKRHDISILLCQATREANCIDKQYLQAGGDSAELRYFGMTDYVPWLSSERLETGKSVNFYYDVCGKLPKGDDPNIVAVAPTLWNDERANELWNGMARWKKWSSVNSGDSFKEKAAAFKHCSSDSSACIAFLHAEHNRWWTERILAGWIPGPRDNEHFVHPNLVPFDELPADIADIDKINIAAMAKFGLFDEKKNNV